MAKRLAGALLMAALDTLAQSVPPAPAPAALACAGLTAITADAATIKSATAVTAPLQVGSVNVEVPFCRVQGVARPSPDSEINFEVWLPPTRSAWTGRLKVSGTGGFAGATPYARLAQDVADGFVAAGSDMGHVGGESPNWALKHPEKVKDWGYRAHYFVATAAKALARAHYAEPVARAYFEGCSNGGRQGMMMAQRYPELFDGIAVGAPSMFYADALMALLWTAKLEVPVLGQPAMLPLTKKALISRRVHEACDGIDGVVDQQITNPRACPFNPAVLRCSAADSDDCLTDKELAVAQAIYRGAHTEAGLQRWTGLVLGSENSWDPDFAENGGYGRFIGHVVYSQPSPPFDWRKLNMATDHDLIKQALGPITSAPSPDLTAFKARGGKLIHYHGWNDAIVSPHTSPNYFNAVAQFEKLKLHPKPVFDQRVEALSPGDVLTTTLEMAPTVQAYYRLFMMPGVGHCGVPSDGRGPNAIGGGYQEPPKAYRKAEHHVTSALIKWVEEGVAPEAIVATRVVGDAVVRQRPLCLYPKQAVYKGSGDPDAASNFACAMPALDQLVTTAADVVQVQNALRQREVLGPTR